jgi:hypothetical protein
MNRNTDFDAVLCLESKSGAKPADRLLFAAVAETLSRLRFKRDFRQNPSVFVALTKEMSNFRISCRNCYPLRSFANCTAICFSRMWRDNSISTQCHRKGIPVLIRLQSVKPEIDHIDAVTVAFNRLLLIITIPG